ncbi:MAG: hypothetical protein ACI8UD_000747 [Planctomycetota bacterium]|jgi:hypothetical protein
MRKSLHLSRLLLLGLVPLCSSGCVSYRVRDHVAVQDRLSQDSRTLVVELVGVQAPNVLLSLKLAGNKKVERTIVTDRQLSYGIKSTALAMMDEFGMTPGILIGLPAGLIADVVQLAISGPIVLPVGFFEAFDPADQTTTVVEPQNAQIRSNQDVLVRFGPRQLQTVRHLKGGQILVNTRQAARDALAQGRERLTAQVRLKGDDLRATVVLGPDVLRQLAGKLASGQEGGGR